MRKRVLLIAAAVLAVLILGAAGLIISVNNMLTPVDAAAVEEIVTVEIPQGTGTEDIAVLLEDAGVIRNALIFRLYARWHSLDKGFIAGMYHLSPSMELPEIIERISSGAVHRDTVWFTIPEGFTVEQMASRLASRQLVDEEQFLALVRQPPDNMMAKFAYLEEIDSPNIQYTLEGYLFPDTYEIHAGADETEIITLMLRRMDSVFDSGLKERAHELGLNMHQALTLASIVEREARVDHERALIAGVFHNRLTVNHALESCATIQYILGEVKEVLTYRDLELPSPYNTYLHPGLPPGPIAAPGEAAIRAVLYPEETDYFYFVYKADGTGEHYFSRTLQEHNQKKQMVDN